MESLHSYEIAHQDHEPLRLTEARSGARVCDPQHLRFMESFHDSKIAHRDHEPGSAGFQPACFGMGNTNTHSPARCRRSQARFMERFIPSVRSELKPWFDSKPLRVADPPSASTLQRFNVSSRRAFTLIELLVVMAVVGCLAITLLPALAVTKGNSKLVQCLANHRQIGAACAMYADDFNGWYPIVSIGSVNSYPGSVNHILGAHYTRYVYTPGGGVGVVMPHILQPGQDQNLGYLYADGLVSDGHAFFCPGFDVVDTNALLYPLSAKFYSSPQFMATHGNGAIRSSYMFNPRLVNAAGFGTSSDILRRYQKTSDIKSRDVFTVDYLAPAGSGGVPFNPDNWPHWPYKGLPVGFTDGSAKFCAFNSLYFNAIINHLASDDETLISAEQYDAIFNALRDAP